MNDLLENVIAAIIFTALSTTTGLIVQIFGFSAQTSITVAGAVLLGLAVVFLVVRKYYPLFTRWRTERLVQKALAVKTNETDDARKTFKKKIIERVLLEDVGVGLKQSSSVVEFLNQEACESHIREVSCNAKKVKILTIRGEKYFLGPKSLLYGLCTSKRAKDSSIEVLVLSPDSQHISEELATNLDHESAEEIKAKMRVVFDYLKLLERQNRNLEVKCYNERPNFKVLIFDDVMFVSSFADGGPKNDHTAKMLQITRDGNPLFMGFERYFEDLSKRSVTTDTDKVVSGRA
jgi:hypothetical protein